MVLLTRISRTKEDSRCVCGWSEPAATNAPVKDEPVQPVLRMNILPGSSGFFFHLLSAPKFSTYHLPPPSYLPPTSRLLPTAYQPLPPPHSIARAPETSSRSELGAAEPLKPARDPSCPNFF
jgi:hypothetical protein